MVSQPNMIDLQQTYPYKTYLPVFAFFDEYLNLKWMKYFQAENQTINTLVFSPNGSHILMHTDALF
jgi:hypothetical protein